MDVLCLGAANSDIIAQCAQFPGPDEEVPLESWETLGGGCGANVAVGLARLGHTAGLLTLFGQDTYTDVIKKDLEKEGVDLSLSKTVPGSNGIAFFPVDKTGQRKSYVKVGVGREILPDQIPEFQSRYLFITNMDGPHIIESYGKAAQQAKEAGIPVVFDPGNLFAHRGLKTIKPILSNTYAILPSESDARILTGKDPEAAAQILLSQGPEIVVITLGSKGCLLATKEGSQVLSNPPLDKPIIDTTGAGDAFAAGFLSGLLKSLSLQHVVEQALQIAQDSCTRKGARSVI